MNGFIIDPIKKSIEEIEVSDHATPRITKITALLEGRGHMMTIVNLSESADISNYCPIYFTKPKPDAPFFLIKGSFDEMSLGKTVVLDLTASGNPRDVDFTFADLKTLVTFFN